MRCVAQTDATVKSGRPFRSAKDFSGVERGSAAGGRQTSVDADEWRSPAWRRQWPRLLDKRQQRQGCNDMEDGNSIIRGHRGGENPSGFARSADSQCGMAEMVVVIDIFNVRFEIRCQRRCMVVRSFARPSAIDAGIMVVMVKRRTDLVGGQQQHEHPACQPQTPCHSAATWRRQAARRGEGSGHGYGGQSGIKGTC